MRIVAALALVLVAGCAGQLTAKDHAALTRKAMPGCNAGDAGACAEACGNGGPNVSCDRACKASSGVSCGLLASRFEHEQDADDADSPVRTIGPQDAEEVTGLYERGCTLGHGPSCLQAGGRILNGQGRGKRTAALAVDLLKAGCEKHKDGQACCAMAQLNAKLAQGKNANTITDFDQEAKRWQKVAERRGTECSLEPPPTPAAP
jgi:hypothetical protein